LADGPAIVPFALVPPRFAALLVFGVSAAFGAALLPAGARFAPSPDFVAIVISAEWSAGWGKRDAASRANKRHVPAMKRARRHSPAAGTHARGQFAIRNERGRRL
jgi:hypothetical protein